MRPHVAVSLTLSQPTEWRACSVTSHHVVVLSSESVYLHVKSIEAAHELSEALKDAATELAAMEAGAGAGRERDACAVAVPVRVVQRTRMRSGRHAVPGL